MSAIDAHFDGHAFIPREPVDLPPGEEVQIVIVRKPTRPFPLKELADLCESLPSDPSAPKDLSMEIDHYLYGHPKQNS